MHSWFKYCVDSSEYEKCRNLKDFIARLRKQSNTDAALVPYRETRRFDDYDEDGEFIGKLKAPRYFGAGFEALSETFLTVFGYEFNLAGIAALDSVEKDIEDTGHDITAMSAKQKIYKGKILKKVESGSKVYIQAKATFNPTKEFTTNDGSRIMNFYGNAQGDARMNGQAYQARYILITSGKGLHYKLNNNTQEDIEVINFKKIDRLINNNPLFWNEFRQRLGLAMLPYTPRKDPEYESIEAEIAVTET